ncbi:pectin esterase [Streptomyces sp. NPDC048179]|uniref:pectin esterase n=1 Tax=Streptomyces sp. NPDC048179 TaxID=3365506 RepID=UPI003711AB69
MPTRRTLLAAAAGGAALAMGSATGFTRDRRVLHVRPGDSVQAAVDAVAGPGWTIVVHPGTYREVVHVPVDKAELTIRGAGRDPRAAVIVYDNANGTQRPDGSGTYGTAGSATFTSAAPGLVVRDLTLANDWLRAELVLSRRAVTPGMNMRDAYRSWAASRSNPAHRHTPNGPGRTGRPLSQPGGDTDRVRGQAPAGRSPSRPGHVSAANGDGEALSHLVGGAGAPHADTAPGVPGRVAHATRPDPAPQACRLRSLDRAKAPRFARSCEPWLGWQSMRFAEYRNSGPGAVITVPADRPQLTDAEAASHTPATYLGDWKPQRVPLP